MTRHHFASPSLQLRNRWHNTVSRAAQLLAVAAFGVVMVAVFTASLTAGLSASSLDEDEQAAVLAQRGSLGDLEPPKVSTKPNAPTWNGS